MNMSANARVPLLERQLPIQQQFAAIFHPGECPPTSVLRRVVLRALMFLDASAIIAMIAGESDAAGLAARLGQDSR